MGDNLIVITSYIKLTVALLQKEVLQVLKDHILETSQQKTYLDQLMAVVIDRAPDLLDQVNAAAGLEDAVCWKPHSEEFC